MTRVVSSHTHDRILDVARRLIQTRGFSAFSYADIAGEIGIRKASIHHHYATKADLAVALMIRYRHDFAAALAQVQRERRTAPARLTAYQELFASVLRDDHRLCMCGMLAADFTVLPAEVRAEVRAFFDDNEAWLTHVLADGKKRRQLAFRGKPEARARAILAALEGAMLVARAYRDAAMFDAIAERVLADVAGM